MKKELILISASILLFGVISSGVAVYGKNTVSKTWQGTTGTSGTWSPDEDGTLVSAEIDASYFVTIPAALDLPAEEADYPAYTEEADNVAILAGAHVADDKLVKVALTPDQTFAVSHDGTATENVAYKVKIADNDPIANSNIAGTSQVLQATAAQAHAGVTSEVNVGFDTEPDFTYHGTYTQNVLFTVGLVPNGPITQE